jgi:toxin-antitoxin system PIN domain toxin
MFLIDVNVLIYAYREDALDHAAYHRWLTGIVSSGEPFGIADLVLSGFLRIATHPKLFNPPSSLGSAMEFAATLRGQPNCIAVTPGPRHWEIFKDLCRVTGARGNFIPDAFLAAMALEAGWEWITTDQGFARFPNLRWRHPLSGDEVSADDPHG